MADADSSTAGGAKTVLEDAVSASLTRAALTPAATAATAFGATFAAVATIASRGLDAEGTVLAFSAGIVVVLAAIDLDRRLIPNRIVLPGTAIVLFAHVAVAPGHSLEWMLSALAAGVVFSLAHFASRGGIGMGDVKLALLLGVALGTDVLPALLIGSLAAAAYSVVLLLKGGPGALRAEIPYGPFMAVGALTILLF